MFALYRFSHIFGNMYSVYKLPLSHMATLCFTFYSFGYESSTLPTWLKNNEKNKIYLQLQPASLAMIISVN